MTYYSPQTWFDGAGGGTPVTGARLQHMEDGITNAVADGSAFADAGTRAGIDPTGTTECAAAFQTFLNSCASLGVRAFAKGTFKIGSTITINADVDFGDATFNYTGATGTAVVVGSSATPLMRKRNIRLPRVVNTAKTILGWSQVAGSIGVKVLNCYSCEITIPHVQNFETGLVTAGASSNGTAYTDIHLGQLDNNKVNHRLANDDSTGWCNQNNIFGGRMSHNSAEGTVVSGTRHVLIASSTLSINGNVWHGTSLESPNTVEYHLDCAGQDNMFIGCRWENTGANARVNWTSASKGNVILGGYNSYGITETRAAGAQNEIQSRVTRHFIGGTTGVATATFENPASSANPYLLAMAAGGWAAGDDETTQWLWQMTGQQLIGKQRADATSAPRLVLDFTSGYMKCGAAVTGSRPSASTAKAGAMFYDTTLGKPIWSDGTNWRDAAGTIV